MSRSQTKNERGGKSRAKGKSKSGGKASPKADHTTSPSIERYLTKDTEEVEDLKPSVSIPEKCLSESERPTGDVEALKTKKAKTSSEVQTGDPPDGGKLRSEIKVREESKSLAAESKQEQQAVRGRPRCQPPAAAAQSSRGGRGGTRKKGSTARDGDEEYAPRATRRQVQQSIKDLFPVRRSTRRPKALLESEAFDRMAKRLRNKDEGGLAVVDVEGKGRGVVSTRPFSRGELICEYSGELVSHEEAQRREGEYSQDPSIGCYMYYFSFKGKRLCVDATKDNGRLGRLLNHSKTSSNVITKLVDVDSQPYLCLMAARDIAVGEELQYDYGERNRDAIESHPWLAL